MNVKDIKILKSLSPITVLKKPNPKTKEYLAKLLQEKPFIEFLTIMRNQNGFPTEGLSIEPFIGKNFSDIPIFNNELIRMALENEMHNICKSIGLSDDFIQPMVLLIFFNAFIDVDYVEGFITEPIKFILGRKNIGSSMYDYPHEVGAIIIPYNISQNTLVKWIQNKKNWAEIQKQMDETLTSDPYALRIHKNTDIAFEIFDLKHNKHLSFPKITDELSKKYPDHKYINSEEWIKKNYYEFKQFWDVIKPQKDK